MHLIDGKLKDILIKSGAVTESAFDAAQKDSEKINKSVADILVSRGDIPQSYLIEVLKSYFNIPSIDLRGVIIPQDIITLISENDAKINKVVAFEYDKEKKTLKVAMIDPVDYNIIESLRAKTGLWLEPYFTTSQSLEYAQRQYKEELGQDFNKIISENIPKSISISGETDLVKLAESVSIKNILDNVVEHGVELGASDIHFEPFEKENKIRYRVDGVLHEILSLPRVIEPILIARVKILAGLKIDEHHIPQDGRFSFETKDKINVDIRVNIMPVMHGEKIEMRLLRKAMRPMTLDELGLEQDDINIVLGEIKKPHGMILVTGPTGQGKTTTLYSILNILNTSSVNITTIEDPIEYEIPNINQTQVNITAGITFATGLRSILRQNPDIIMIGEIRDNETVDIAVHAALTGQLVLSSLHTNDAPGALPRLIDMGAPAFLLSSTVNLIVAQRLVRKICATCIESYDVSPEMMKIIEEQLKVSGFQSKPAVPKTLFRGKGCDVCGHSGFLGQIAIFEILKMTDSLRNLVLKTSSSQEIRAEAIKEGMNPMFEDGLEKARQGITTIEEILRMARE